MGTCVLPTVHLDVALAGSERCGWVTSRLAGGCWSDVLHVVRLMGGARYPKHPILWFHVMLVMLVMHVILPQCGSSMIKRYQAWEAWVCQQQEGNDRMGKLKNWKNGNDKNDHFIVSLSRATNLPAGKVGQTDWVGSIGHLNDISDYFEKTMKHTIYTTTFLSIFLYISRCIYIIHPISPDYGVPPGETLDVRLGQIQASKALWP